MEAQFYEGGEFMIGQRFEDLNDGERIVKARELAIVWAKAERQTIESRFED